MLLSIDPEKVKRQLKENPLTYTVVSFDVKPEEIEYDLSMDSGVVTVTPVMPPDLEEARKRVLNLRQKLVDKRTRFLSSEELEQEIDEIKGRK